MFMNMKKGSVIVNVGRGAVVDENALYNALNSGKLLGAAIDVFDKEPLNAQSPLWNMENFYFSPHNSLNSNLNGEKMAEYMLENLKRFKDGKELLNLV